MDDLLWVYGSLLSPIQSAFGMQLAQEASLLGPAWATGDLFDLGQYPAFVYRANGTRTIQGEVWRLKDPSTTFESLDPYESYDPKRPADENLYLRELLPVTASSGSIFCWIYTYHGQLTGLPLIQEDDYYSFWRKNKLHQQFTRPA